MPRLLKWLLPKSVPTPERDAHPIESVEAAPSPTPELDEAVRQQRGLFHHEVLKLDKTAADIRMALSRNTLDFRTRPN